MTEGVGHFSAYVCQPSGLLGPSRPFSLVCPSVCAVDTSRVVLDRPHRQRIGVGQFSQSRNVVIVQLTATAPPGVYRAMRSEAGPADSPMPLLVGVCDAKWVYRAPQFDRVILVRVPPPTGDVSVF